MGPRRRWPFFLRWSFVRMVLGARHLQRTWQVGDGREEALATYVVRRARRGDPEDAIRAIDAYAYEEKFLINVGDVKGKILDDAVRRANARRVLELGTYCGYSALRMAVAAPEARIVSIELNSANAAIARRIFEHAGVADRIDVLEGTLETVDPRLDEAALDVVFLDHAKDAYLPDLRRVLERRWLRKGGLAVADNVRIPGAPAYRAYMRQSEGGRWRTTEHWTHAEYQRLFADLVLVSELLEP